jgi:hypothetical protein
MYSLVLRTMSRKSGRRHARCDVAATDLCRHERLRGRVRSLNGTSMRFSVRPIPAAMIGRLDASHGQTGGCNCGRLTRPTRALHADCTELAGDVGDRCAFPSASHFTQPRGEIREKVWTEWPIEMRVARRVSFKSAGRGASMRATAGDMDRPFAGVARSTGLPTLAAPMRPQRASTGQCFGERGPVSINVASKT